MSEKSVQQSLDEMFDTASELAGHARTDAEKQIIVDLLSDIAKARMSFHGNIPVMCKESFSPETLAKRNTAPILHEKDGIEEEVC